MAGKDIKLNMINGMLPDMSETLTGWEVSIFAIVVKQEMIDGEIVEHKIKKVLKGVIQPLKAEEVALKPDGQREWKWYQVHVKKHYPILRAEQKIEIMGKTYKIMAVKDYNLYGYVEYHVVKDYE